jgi:hypothetical protein
MDSLNAWYTSPEYQPLIALRKSCTCDVNARPSLRPFAVSFRSGITARRDRVLRRAARSALFDGNTGRSASTPHSPLALRTPGGSVIGLSVTRTVRRGRLRYHYTPSTIGMRVLCWAELAEPQPENGVRSTALRRSDPADADPSFEPHRSCLSFGASSRISPRSKICGSLRSHVAGARRTRTQRFRSRPRRPD